MPDNQMDLMRWLSDQFGHLREGLGRLQAGQAENRRTVLDVRRELSERMDRMDTRSGRTPGLISRIPWRIVLQLAIGGALLLGGHLTVPEMKSLLGLVSR